MEMDTEGPHDVAGGLSPLERLPPELLVSIFDRIPYYSMARNPMYASGISRTLHPYLQRLLYRRIRFRSSQSPKHRLTTTFLDFWTATKDNSELAELVEKVEVPTGDGEDDQAAREREAMFDFLKSATALNSLEVEGSASKILTAKFAILCYRRLESLAIDCSSEGQELRYLAFLPMLKSLSLYFDSGLNLESDASFLREDQLVLQLIEKDVPEHLGLEALNLSFCQNVDNTAPLVDTTAQLVAFISKCSSLSSLGLIFDFDEAGVDLRPLLQAVCPDQLIKLDIGSDCAAQLSSNLHESIARFTSLTSLSLHVGFCTQLVAQAITQLPLIESVAVESSLADHRMDSQHTLNHSCYRTLLQNRTLLPLLSSLTIPPLEFAVGRKNHKSDDYTVSYSRITGRAAIPAGWKRPVWPPLCTRDQAKEIVQMVKERKITLHSDLEEAVLQSERYDEEAEWCVGQPGVLLVD